MISWQIAFSFGFWLNKIKHFPTGYIRESILGQQLIKKY